MIRRGFLKALGGLGLAGAAPAAALKPAAALLEGGAWMANVPIGAAAVGIPVTYFGLTKLAYDLYERLQRDSWTRDTWAHVWRQYRKKLRKHKVREMPAKLLWLQHKIKMARAERNGATPSVDQQWRRRQKRIEGKLKAAGLLEHHPWLGRIVGSGVQSVR